ncbi:MAG TPA: hypothetical protein VFO44_04725, partial [Steroidobacteraceae bacterium]|nr:hypothetical protein [Steroidobacteraceae bacterium]
VTASSSAGTPTLTPSPFVIGCDAGTGGTTVQFSFTAAGQAGGGGITIQVTAPNGTVTLLSIPVTVT